MNLYVCGSSSKGNCYILESEAGKIILDCGVNFREVQKALNFNLKNFYQKNIFDYTYKKSPVKLEIFLYLIKF